MSLELTINYWSDRGSLKNLFSSPLKDIKSLKLRLPLNPYVDALEFLSILTGFDRRDLERNEGKISNLKSDKLQNSRFSRGASILDLPGKIDLITVHFV